MKPLAHTKEDEEELNSILQCARNILSTQSALPWIFNAISGDKIFVLTGTFKDDEEKKKLINTIKLFTVKENISEYYLLSEMWFRTIPTSEPPGSQHEDKHEGVIVAHVKRVNDELYARAYGYAINRSTDGKFLSLGENIFPEGEDGGLDGTMVNLISPVEPTLKIRKETEEVYNLGMSLGKLYKFDITEGDYSIKDVSKLYH